ncbi:hypothetical protein DICA3_B09494 [Diutina catenulata]
MKAVIGKSTLMLAYLGVSSTVPFLLSYQETHIDPKIKGFANPRTLLGKV